MKNNKIKLLYIANGITGVGGLERTLLIKAGYLIDFFDYEVHILTLNEDGKRPFYQFNEKTVFHSIPYTGILSYFFGIRKAVGEIKPDIVAVCDDGLKGFFVPHIIGRKNTVIYERHATTMINETSSWKRKVLFSIMRNRVKYFDRFIILTLSNMNEWNGRNVQVIPNSLGFFPEKASSVTNKSVIAVGSHSFNKGYDLLLQSWSIVNKRFPEWKLNIFGKYDTDNTFILMSEKMNLSDSITFYKPTQDILNKYLESSVMVVSSRSEGFGMVLIEAMACGLPCVSFDCPYGPSDIITDGDDGFLVENGNTDAFAERIMQLIEDETLRKKMGAAAKENVKRFMPENIISQWDKLFKELVNGK